MYIMYKALIIVNNESIPPKMSLHKVSDRHMTYTIAPNPCR